jgi:hypothetical protein
MLTELSIDHFRFDCAGCGCNWTIDYGVRHVESGCGAAWDCYSRNGHRVTDPTARGVVCCPRCGASLVHVQLMASRAAAAAG